MFSQKRKFGFIVDPSLKSWIGTDEIYFHGNSVKGRYTAAELWVQYRLDQNWTGSKHSRHYGQWEAKDVEPCY